ncbi:helix-turn-helix domain-containing protein [Microbacterium sp. SS28]|uniref:helix-turn-helix domain-containing protein n=1 Tax=Microbacterium sp. SS28 TaxID=2919948 RepID=UPI001FAA8F40|nr:helix-turn-helix domain-containing protein [Microbacterium sp. SS28]
MGKVDTSSKVVALPISISGPAEPAWVSIRDAAERKRLSVKTIRRYISAGYIHAERVGPKLIRVSVASLDALGTPLQYRGGAS